MEIDIKTLIQTQRTFFEEGNTLSYGFRIKQLKKLKKAILEQESAIADALWKDLHKSRFEAYATEIGFVIRELGHHIRHLNHWMHPGKVPTGQMIHFWSSSRIYPQPYGQVLIIAPWNYPFQLLIQPLIGAISAGNCVILKPSELTPNVSGILARIIAETFSPEYIRVVEGGVAVSKELLEHPHDYIFFTGSPRVGRIVMEKAATHLTPVSLELGGKSPCIVDADAHLKHAAARIVWGKFLNAGQTCIAPDYLLVHASVKEKLLEYMKQDIQRYYGTNPADSPDYCRIVNEEKTLRLERMLKDGTIFCGGKVDSTDRYMAPTILTDVSPDSPVMQEEIFGPILPVLTFESLHEVIAFVNARPRPLALYYFSRNRKKQKRILRHTCSGGACINEVLMQWGNEMLPFGGVGNSGLGNYHGKYSFDTFTHEKGVLRKSNLTDLPLRYPPYGKRHRILKCILK